jgi:hypothetical protein
VIPASESSEVIDGEYCKRCMTSKETQYEYPRNNKDISMSCTEKSNVELPESHGKHGRDLKGDWLCAKCGFGNKCSCLSSVLMNSAISAVPWV